MTQKVSSKEPLEILSENSVVDGYNIHYLKGGKGEPLVLLQGFFSNSETYRGFINYLGRYFTVYVPDFPGFGKTETLPGKPSLKDSAKLIINWIKQMGLKNVILVGISMGGTNAIYFAQEIDDLVKVYILIEPFAGVETLTLSQALIKNVKKWASFFDRAIFSPLGNFIWKSDRIMILLLDLIDPFKDEERPENEKLKIIRCADFPTFVHTLNLLVNLDIKNEGVATKRKAIFIMAPKDDCLDYEGTKCSFRKIFPNMQFIEIDMAKHRPTAPLTARYLNMKFPRLRENILKLIA